MLSRNTRIRTSRVVKVNRIIFTFALLLSTTVFSFASYADWEKMTTSEVGTSYLDFDSIKIIGEYVHYWVLVDHWVLSSGGYLSTLAGNKGDCSLERFQVEQLYMNKGKMGKGERLRARIPKEAEWVYPPPDSPASWELEHACKHITR